MRTLIWHLTVGINPAFMTTAVEWLAVSRSKATASAVNTWMGDRLLYFLGDPANATFGGS